MPIATIEIKGAKEIMDKLSKLDEVAKQELSNSMGDIGADMVSKVKQEIADLDAVDTGNMRDSVESNVDNDGLELTIGVNDTTAPYAIYPHWGWSTSQKYGPRPFMLTTLSREEANIRKKIEEAINRATKNL